MLLAGLFFAFRFSGKVDARAEPVHIMATPLALDSSDPARVALGRLRFLRAWSLSGDSPQFGGISSILVRDGRVLALNDTGALIGFSVPPVGSRPFISPLPARKEPGEHSSPWDSESLVHDPVSGRYWVGFELVQRICRYAPQFARVESCMSWPAMKAWSGTESIEAMARLPGGRFLAFSEGAAGEKDGNDLLYFAGDPAEKTSPPPVHLNYIPPRGYRPTDAVSIGGDRVLVLNRRVTIADGFTAVLSVIDVSDLKPGAVLKSREVARFVPPVLAENFEALSVEKRGNQSILWIASDDNHKFFQRTLLMEFLLPPELSLP